MSISSRCAAALSVMLMLSACAQLPPAKAIDPSIKSHVTATQAVLTIPQTEIYADIVRSGGGGGGLIGALIDTAVENARTKKAEQAMVPVRNELLDFDFDSTMTSDLQTGISQMDWLHAGTVKVDKDPSADDLNKLVGDADQPYSLVVNVDYHLTPDFHALLVKVAAALFPKHSDSTSNSGQRLKPTDPKNAVFSQIVVYRENIPDDTLDAIELPPKPPVKKGPDGRPLPPDKPNLDDDQQQAVIYWTQDGAKVLKAALADATAVTSRVVSQALAGPLAAPAGAQRVKVDSYGKGLVLEKDPARVLVLLDDHSVVSSDVADVDFLK